MLLLAIATPAFARIDFNVVHAGEQLRGAEICFFPTPARPRDLSDTLFHSGDVTCLPADQLLELPAGAWLYFARHRAGFISDYRPLVSMPRDEPADNLRNVQEEVVPAATVRVTQVLPMLQHGQRLVVISESQHAGTIVLPLVAGEDFFLVPANATFVVALIANDRPIRLSEPMKLEAGKRVEINALPAHSSAMHDVIAWISFPDEKYPVDFTRLEPPRVRLIAHEQTFAPIFRTNTAALAETLLVFKNVPRVSASVRLDGDLWSHDEVSSLSSDAVEVIEEPLTTQPAAAIRAMVTLPPTTNRACKDKAMAPSVSLLSCSSNADACKTLQTASAPHEQSVTFGGLLGGTYVVEFDPAVAGAKPRRTVHAEIGVVGDVRIEPDYFSFYGNVLLGGKPVSRMLDFWRRGMTVSDPVEGNYAVTLSEAPPDSLRIVRVVDCEDERDVYMHIAASVPKAGERFDIVIPDNSISVKLQDAGTNDGLAGAVRLIAYEDETHEGAQFTRTHQTDSTGSATIAHVTREAPLSVCGESEGYEPRCVARFHMGASEVKSVNLQLSRVRGSRGHLEARGPIEYGRLWWVSEGGTITEAVDVQTNGDFRYERSHTPRESIIVASGTHPLALLASPMTAADTLLELTYPMTRRRDILVRLDNAGVDQAALGISIGNVPIPTAAFAYHQQFHGAQFVVDTSASLRIHDVQESAPITVVLGPDSPAALANLPPGTDWMSVPSYVLSRPRLTVGTSNEVTFRH